MLKLPTVFPYGLNDCLCDDIITDIVGSKWLGLNFMYYLEKLLKFFGIKMYFQTSLNFTFETIFLIFLHSSE